MKKIYILFTVFNLFVLSLTAQSLDQAKAWYQAGDYEQAKPVFERLIKSAPSNANYNLWYGVCCLKTGSPQEALKYLKTAVQRKVPTGQLYLGETYNELYMFEDAVDIFESYINDLTKRKRPTEDAELLLEKSKSGLRMIRAVDEICFIDSIVVGKEDFLSNYRISPETGKLYTYNQYFKTEGDHPGTVYETELGNKLYYGKENAEGILNIYSTNKLANDWSEPYELPERINGSGDTNYPFVMTDGITIYFGSTGEQSMGGYDIFVTRYNTNTDSYLAPENIGMPFNSPFNDYMYVIDEFNNLGWFASDRYQPEDSVCIYVFIPNESKRTYNYEGMELEQITQLAKIHSIRDTWTDEEVVTNALKRLESAIEQKPEAKRKVDFTFIINDKNTYNYYSQFKSQNALNQFKTYQLKEKDMAKQIEKLNDYRKQYQTASISGKEKLTPSILDLELRIDIMRTELDAMAIEVRNTEIKAYK